LVYEELRKLAEHRMAREAPGQTLQATALVHEVYMRLVGTSDADAQRWACRGHFFAAAADAMRRILIERARAKGALKRGGGIWSGGDVTKCESGCKNATAEITSALGGQIEQEREKPEARLREQRGQSEREAAR
jgi:RNA polymerase sigma factor (TIGR02999 family)